MMIDTSDLIFLLYRAKTHLQQADSESAWRLVLADLVSRVGELITDEESKDGNSKEPDPIIGDLVSTIEGGYKPVSNRAKEIGKQKLAYMVIRGGEYVDDTIITTAMASNLSPAQLELVLSERLQWGPCRTKPEAVKRVRDHLGLKTSTAEHRVEQVCKTYGLRLEPGRKFGHPKKGGPSLG